MCLLLRRPGPLPGESRVGPAFACGANDLYAGHGAQLTYAAAQLWSYETLSLQLNSTVVRRDARVQSLNLHLGGRQSRHESLSQLQAPGAFSEMLALTVADGDAGVRPAHAADPPGARHQERPALQERLLDQAKTIFSGLIVVDPDAQKTDAYQSNRNLMLSPRTRKPAALPGLEIQANDVRCTHGATSSRIDPEQEFYLQSRGIRRTPPTNLLFGFFEEVLNRLESDELHARCAPDR
jgi:Fe-S cluster assembly protein SufD